MLLVLTVAVRSSVASTPVGRGTIDSSAGLGVTEREMIESTVILTSNREASDSVAELTEEL